MLYLAQQMASNIMQFQIQGLFAYCATDEIKNNRLHVGSIVRLIPEPQNEYDRNAIVVLMNSNEAKLGYVPREQAKKLVNKIGDYSTACVISVGINNKKNPFCTVEMNSISNEMVDIISSKIVELKDICGIYSIYNKINHKEYIGSSKNIGNRIKRHISMLSKNCHHSKEFQKDWGQFTKSSFDVKLLEIVLNLDKLYEREQYYIDSRRSHISGYNASKFADQSKKYNDELDDYYDNIYIEPTYTSSPKTNNDEKSEPISNSEVNYINPFNAVLLIIVLLLIYNCSK